MGSSGWFVVPSSLQVVIEGKRDAIEMQCNGGWNPIGLNTSEEWVVVELDCNLNSNGHCQGRRI